MTSCYAHLYLWSGIQVVCTQLECQYLTIHCHSQCPISDQSRFPLVHHTLYHHSPALCPHHCKRLSISTVCEYCTHVLQCTLTLLALKHDILGVVILSSVTLIAALQQRQLCAQAHHTVHVYWLRLCSRPCGVHIICSTAYQTYYTLQAMYIENLEIMELCDVCRLQIYPLLDKRKCMVLYKPAFALISYPRSPHTT